MRALVPGITEPFNDAAGLRREVNECRAQAGIPVVEDTRRPNGFDVNPQTLMQVVSHQEFLCTGLPAVEEPHRVDGQLPAQKSLKQEVDSLRQEVNEWRMRAQWRARAGVPSMEDTRRPDGFDVKPQTLMQVVSHQELLRIGLPTVEEPHRMDNYLPSNHWRTRQMYPKSPFKEIERGKDQNFELNNKHDQFNKTVFNRTCAKGPELRPVPHAKYMIQVAITPHSPGGHHGRTLRSGKGFSAYDLAVGTAISPPRYFSVADCLKQRLEAQQFAQILDEPVDIIPTLRPPSPPASSPSRSPPACPPPPPFFWVARDLPAKPATKLDRKKLGSKRRKRERRELEAAQSQDSGLKAIHWECCTAAKKNTLRMDFDVADLPHSMPSWIGKRSAEDGTQAPDVDALPTSSPRAIGMGSRVYTQKEIDRMSGTKGFTYIDWLGEYILFYSFSFCSNGFARLTILIVDSHRCLIALLGGKPKDLLGWKIVTDGTAHLLDSLLPRAHFTAGDSLHRRAHPESPYPSVSRGLSHGGGQTNIPGTWRALQSSRQHRDYGRDARA
ncbi:hypothetical protein B0H14DRAFT_3713105 [Mycena olivaceomarginata]|nr:hypothetical protein B0H14DRAFT_3713105 [Mycena olivaceomarginata]